MWKWEHEMSFSSAFIQLSGSQYLHLDTLLSANKTWRISPFSKKEKFKIYFYYSVNDERVVECSMFMVCQLKENIWKNGRIAIWMLVLQLFKWTRDLLSSKILLTVIVARKTTRVLNPDSIICNKCAFLIEFVFVCPKWKEILCLHSSHRHWIIIMCLDNMYFS